MEMINGKTVLGLVHEVKIFHPGSDSYKLFQARIDTGATKSSLDSKIVEDMKLGPVVASKVVRSAHGKKRREIIMVDIELTGKRMTEAFTIAERGHMKYPLLIGQNILKYFLIDPSQ